MSSRSKGDLDVSKLLDKIAKEKKAKKGGKPFKKNYRNRNDKQKDKVPTVKVPFNQNLPNYLPPNISQNAPPYIRPNMPCFPNIPPQFRNHPPMNQNNGPSTLRPNNLPFNQVPPNNSCPPGNLNFPPPNAQIGIPRNFNVTGGPVFQHNNPQFPSNVPFPPPNACPSIPNTLIPEQNFQFNRPPPNSRHKEENSYHHSNNNSSKSEKSAKSLVLPPPPPPPQLKTPPFAKGSFQNSNISNSAHSEKCVNVPLYDIQLPPLPASTSPVYNASARKPPEPKEPPPETPPKDYEYSNIKYRSSSKHDSEKYESKQSKKNLSLDSTSYRERSRSQDYSDNSSDEHYHSSKAKNRRHRSRESLKSKHGPLISKLTDAELQKKIDDLKRKCDSSPMRDYSRSPSEEDFKFVHDCHTKRPPFFQSRGRGPRFLPPNFVPRGPGFRPPFDPKLGFMGGYPRRFGPRGINGRFPFMPFRMPSGPMGSDEMDMPPDFDGAPYPPHNQGPPFFPMDFDNGYPFGPPSFYPVYSDDIVPYDKDMESYDERSPRVNKRSNRKRRRDSKRKVKSKWSCNENESDTMRFTTITKDVKRTKEVRRMKEVKNHKRKVRTKTKKKLINYDDLEPGECISSSEETSEYESASEQDNMKEGNKSEDDVSDHVSSYPLKNDSLKVRRVRTKNYSSSTSCSGTSSESSSSESDTSSCTSSSSSTSSSDSEMSDEQNKEDICYSKLRKTKDNLKNLSHKIEDFPSASLPPLPTTLEDFEENNSDINKMSKDSPENSSKSENVESSQSSNASVNTSVNRKAPQTIGDNTQRTIRENYGDIDSNISMHDDLSLDKINPNNSKDPQLYELNEDNKVDETDVEYKDEANEPSIPPIPIPSFDEFKKRNRAGSISPNDSLEFEEYCLFASTHELLSASKHIFKSPTSPKSMSSKKVYEKPIIKVESGATAERKLKSSSLQTSKKVFEDSPVKRNKVDLDSRIKQIMEKPGSSTSPDKNDLKNYIYNHKTMRLYSHPPSPFRSRRAYHFWYRETYHFRKQDPMPKEFFDPTICRKVQGAMKVLKVYSPETEEIINRPFKPELLELFKKDSKEDQHELLDTSNLNKINTVCDKDKSLILDENANGSVSQFTSENSDPISINSKLKERDVELTKNNSNKSIEQLNIAPNENSHILNIHSHSILDSGNNVGISNSEPNQVKINSEIATSSFNSNSNVTKMNIPPESEIELISGVYSEKSSSDQDASVNNGDEIIQLVMQKFMDELRSSVLDKLTDDIISEQINQ